MKTFWGSGDRALDGGERSASRSGHFTPREGAPVTHWIGGLDAVVKRKNCQDLEAPIIQPVGQCYATALSQILIIILNM